MTNTQPVPGRGRFAVRDAIRALDPVRDHQRICYLSACYDFPWDFARALEMALFRTFGIAKGTSLLLSTGEFVQRTQKRYDDTVLILGEILENGYDSDRGRAALRRMNQQHAHYTIPNDEYLYTLSTFLFEPLRWNARFGWRRCTDHERTAAFQYWLNMGERMAIRDLPTDIDAFERWNVAYEREHFVFAPANQQIAEAGRALLLGWYLPRPLWGMGASLLSALIDEPLLRAVGFGLPPRWLRRVVEGVMRTRGIALRLLPSRARPFRFTALGTATYPNGYEIDQLGADRART